MKLKTVFISTYTFFKNGVRTNNSGPVTPLIAFFSDFAEKLYIVEQPLPGSDSLVTQLTIIVSKETVEQIEKNFITPKMKISEYNKTYIRLKIRDMLSNFYFTYKKYNELRKEQIDLFIGVECLNAIFGIMLKKIGIVDRVVYYIFDWAPDRYQNPIMNKVYILLDKMATYHSDYTWNITYTIAEARKNILMYDENKMSPQLYVPYCVDFDENRLLADENVDTNLIIYSGGLIEENGPQLLIEAYKIVLDRFPESRLMIIGGGGIEQKLRDFITQNNMEKNVEITGYIADQERIIDLQCKGVIGVAPYPNMAGSRKPYGDVIKIRMYFACGLVTVTTPVPPVSKEIDAYKLGYTTLDDSPEELAKGICLFLENKELLFRYRRNVIEKAELSSWEQNYTSALGKMGVDLENSGKSNR